MQVWGRVTTRSSRVKPLVGGMVLVLLAVVSMAVTGSKPAFAVDQADQARQQLPIVAGTELKFTGKTCTAGLVLVGNGVLSNVTSYQRAVRYVLTGERIVLGVDVTAWFRPDASAGAETRSAPHGTPVT